MILNLMDRKDILHMNIAIIEQGFRKYLFEVPESISLKEGEKVKCDTKRGVTDGTVWADSITTDEPTAKLIGKLLGAKFPLKSVVGKTVTSVEMFEQPEQPKQEPVRLYCVKDFSALGGKRNLIAGKVYEFDGSRVNYDNIECAEFEDFDDWKRGDPSFAACLVPLVSRPAKVGEWVYIRDATPICEQAYKNGDVFKITHMHKRFSHNACNDQQGDWFEDEEYLVLDGYKPEPEKADPEYYSGKVVCVEATDRCVTLGKVYTVKKGVFTWNNGTRANTKATTIEQFNNWFIAAKFIEFKGE